MVSVGPPVTYTIKSFWDRQIFLSGGIYCKLAKLDGDRVFI